MFSRPFNSLDTVVYINDTYVPYLTGIKCEQTMKIESESPIQLTTAAHRITLEYPLFRDFETVDFRAINTFTVFVNTPFVKSTYSNCQVLSMEMVIEKQRQYYKVVIIAQSRVDERN